MISKIFLFLIFLANPNRIFSNQCPPGYVGLNCELECGLNFNKANVKIIGGVEAVPFSWPSTAFIHLNYKQNELIANNNTNESRIVEYYGKCLGSLIDRDTVLTTSNCFPSGRRLSKTLFKIEPNEYYQTYESMMTVYLGLHDFSIIDKSPVENENASSSIWPAVKASVRKLIRHIDYNSTTFFNDIALIKLDKSVTLNEYIQLACLPIYDSINYPQEQVEAWTAGWGDTIEANKSFSYQLNNIQFYVFPGESICKGVHTSVAKNWSMQICSGLVEGGRGPCDDDGGGAIFIRDKIGDKQKYVLVGQTGYALGCAWKNLGTVNTRVSYYMKWLKENWFENIFIEEPGKIKPDPPQTPNLFWIPIVLVFGIIALILVLFSIAVLVSRRFRNSVSSLFRKCCCKFKKYQITNDSIRQPISEKPKVNEINNTYILPDINQNGYNNDDYITNANPYNMPDLVSANNTDYIQYNDPTLKANYQQQYYRH